MIRYYNYSSDKFKEFSSESENSLKSLSFFIYFYQPRPHIFSISMMIGKFQVIICPSEREYMNKNDAKKVLQI